MLPAIVAAWALLYCRLRWAHRVACRYRVALATKVPVIHKFFDELEVEVSPVAFVLRFYCCTAVCLAGGAGGLVPLTRPALALSLLAAR